MVHQLSRPFDAENDILLGEAGGRVEITWYVDYTCPHTRRIRDILRRSPARFGRDGASVAVRFIIPHNDEDGAAIAARAAVAAHRQDRFSDMHRALFDAPPDYSVETVEELARDLDLDMKRFREDMAEADAKLEADRDSLGDTSDLHMPLIFIDGRFYEGAWDETALIEAIEQPLGVRLSLAGNDFFHWAASAGLVLILATLAALPA